MPTFRAKMEADGRVTLPAALRERFGLLPGDDVEFFITLDGDVFFHAITGKAEAWQDRLAHDRRMPPLSIREMDEAVAEGLREKHFPRQQATRQPAGYGSPKTSAAE